MRLLILFWLLTTASISDIRYRKVDNLLILIAFAAGIALDITTLGIAGSLDALMTVIIVFAVLYPLFSIRLMGAGDIKFLMAVITFIGKDGLMTSLIPIAFSSVAIMLVMGIAERGFTKLKIPMTVPISMGILFGMNI